MRAADVLLFVVDVRDGITPLDREVAGQLRRLGKPVVVAANKADAAHYEPLAGEFFALGFGEPVPVSALQGFGREELKERLCAVLPPPSEAALPEEAAVRIAVVGKRNVGKSTLVNALCREERMIVSEIPGTTRDAVDVRFERDGEVFIVVDTAGLRRRQSIEHAIEFFGRLRTEQAIARADVVLLVLDVTTEVSVVEKQLARAVKKGFKPCVLVANKWDLARDRIATSEFQRYIEKKLPGLSFAPIVFTSAIESRGVFDALRVARELHLQARVRAPTAELNRAIEEATREVSPRVGRDGTVPRIYYATQTKIAPPTIVLFVNKPALFDDRYRRYLVHKLGARFGFAEIPVRMLFRERLTIYQASEREEREVHRRWQRGGRPPEPDRVPPGPVTEVGEA